jgi:SAM-dependent methyltransferase
VVVSNNSTKATAVAYEYRGLKAATWDLFLGQAPVWEDTLFFREMIARYGQPALELGCGTGRLLLEYLADGIDIDGVDNSPEMLDICRSKAAQRTLKPGLFQQAMEQLSLPRQYKTIIVPAGSFQLITNPAQARQALQHIVDHLQPGGRLAMRFLLLWQPGQPEQNDWRLVGQVTRPNDNARICWRQQSRFDLTNQLEHTVDQYEVLLDGDVIATEEHVQSPAARWYTRNQATTLLQEAGLVDIQLVEPLAAMEQNRNFAVIGRRD